MYLVLTKLQHSLSKGYSSQHCLLVVLQKLKRAVDTGKDIGAPLTDLLETFDSLSHKLIIAKPCAYEFSFSAINLIQNFQPKEKKELMSNSNSFQSDSFFGFAQGSILSDLFLIFKDVNFASYTDSILLVMTRMILFKMSYNHYNI